jgi:hypothetical protein
LKKTTIWNTISNAVSYDMHSSERHVMEYIFGRQE